MSPLRRREAMALAVGALGTALATRLGAQDPAGTRLHRQHTGDLGALIAVDAQLGGRPWRCLVDSGASIAVVSPAVAAAQRLPVRERTRVATVGGVVELERVELPPLDIAGQRIEGLQALVLDVAQQLGDAGAGIGGLLGAPLLRERVTRLDLAGGRLHWGREIDPAAGAVWPLRWDRGLPVIELRLGDRDPAPFLFDTGNAGALVVFARHASRLMGDNRGANQELPRVTMAELGGPVTVHQALLQTLTAPGYTAHDVPVVFEAGPAARRGAHFDRLAGSAGLALFAAGAVTLDGPGGRLVVEQPGLPAVPALPGGFGFALRSMVGAPPEVSAVFAGGPAARAGVQPGQRLRAIDDQALDGVGAGEVWRRLAGAASARFDFDGLAAPRTLARERFFVRWR